MEPKAKRAKLTGMEQKVPGKRRARKKKSKSIGEQSLQIPRRFLDKCVRTTEQLAASSPSLSIRENFSVSHTAFQAADPPISDIYEITRDVYEPLLDIFAGAKHMNERPNLRGAPQARVQLNGKKVFKNDAVHLRFPDKGQTKGGTGFLSATVERFSRDIGANLITICAEDLIDLIEYFDESVPDATARVHCDNSIGYSSPGNCSDANSNILEPTRVSPQLSATHIVSNSRCRRYRPQHDQHS